MHISAKVDYGLRALCTLASSGAPQTADQLAEAQGLPVRFLRSILNELRRGAIVNSHRGNEGGYQLARPAGEITVGEVFLDRCSGCAFEVAVDLEPFEEPAGVAGLLEVVAGDEVVVAPVNFVAPGSPVSRGDGEPEVGFPFQEGAHDGRLPGAGRAGDDEADGQGTRSKCSMSFFFWFGPRPRRRRLSLMSRSFMSRRAFTLPV